MIEDIFLTYSNNSLKGSPEKLYSIFQVIGENINIDLEDVDKSIEIICELSQYINPNEYLSVVNEKYNSGGFYNPIEHPARSAVVGNRDSYYFDLIRFKDDRIMKEHLEDRHRNVFDCSLRKINKKLLGRDLCEDGFVQKCYECYQLDFINVLQDIIGGKEYSEIEDIDTILYDSSTISTRRTFRNIGQSNQNTPFREELITQDLFDVGYRDYMNRPEANCSHAFCIYLNSIAFYSLTEFLIHNDRRKIKKCDYCGKFFIAKDIKRTTRCYSDECRKAYERDKKRKQRGDDPVRYV